MQTISSMGLLGMAPGPAEAQVTMPEAVRIASRKTPAPAKRRKATPAPEAKPTADDGLTVITEAQARAHESGARQLPDGSYSVRDARGRHKTRLDVGERICRRAAADVLARRIDQAASAYENRPQGYWARKKAYPC